MTHLYKDGEYVASYSTPARAQWSLEFYSEYWPGDEWALGPNPMEAKA